MQLRPFLLCNKYSKGIDKYIETVAALFNHPLQAEEWLGIIREQKPRYIRDQLQAIQKNIKDIDVLVTEKALNYCLKHNLFSAVDFNDAVDHFGKMQSRERLKKTGETSFMEIKPLDEIDRSKFETKPMIRDFDYYKEVLERGNVC